MRMMRMNARVHRCKVQGGVVERIVEWEAVVEHSHLKCVVCGVICWSNQRVVYG